MAADDLNKQDINLNDVAFDSAIALSDSAWQEDLENLVGFFIFGFEYVSSGQKFCHVFPLNKMGSNWDYPHFYDYKAASYDFYYYDDKRDPSFTEIYDEYFPEKEKLIFSRYIQYVYEQMAENGTEVNIDGVWYQTTYAHAKMMAGCTNLPDTEEELDEFPLLNQEQNIASVANNIKDNEEGNKIKTKIRRTNVAHSELGLTVVLYPDDKNYRGIIKNNYRGFRALVHGPLEFAEVAGKGFSIGKGEEAFVGIKPQYLESSEAVKNMPLKQKQCLFPEEDLSQYPDVKIKVFAKYTHKACLLECQAERIMKQCNCLPYYFPRFDLVWNRNTACDFEGMKCLAKHANQAKAMFVGEPGFLNGSDCNCPSDCDITSYFTAITRTDVIGTNKVLGRIRQDENTIIRNLTLTLKNYG